ncbi:hypothetical protein Tco_0608280 [Tanacetum coccineum]
MSMFEARHQNGYANVTWLIAKWLKRKGVGSQRESMICCGQFITRMARKMSLLSDENAVTPAPGVPRVPMPKPPRPTMQDLYDRKGRIEIRQGTLKRMSRRHSDRYARFFEYMAGQDNISLQGGYVPPGYDEEQQQEE